MHVQCGNITFRPSKKPDLHHERVSGSEGGNNSSESRSGGIQRSPRPDDIPEERPLSASGKVKKPTSANQIPDTNQESEDRPEISDDPSSGKARPAATSVEPATTEEGYLSGSEDFKGLYSSTTTEGASNMNTRDSGASPPPTSATVTATGTVADIFEVWEGESGPDPERTRGGAVKEEEGKLEEEAGRSSNNSPGGSKRASTRDPSYTTGGSKNSNLPFGLSTQPSYESEPDGGNSSPTFHTKGRQNNPISKLNDEETWGNPVDNDLKAGDNVFLDNNSFNDDKSQLNIDSKGAYDAHDPGKMSGDSNPDRSTTQTEFSTTGE